VEEADMADANTEPNPSDPGATGYALTAPVGLLAQPGGIFEGIDADLTCPQCACTVWAHDAVIGVGDATIEQLLQDGCVTGALYCELCERACGSFTVRPLT
jgi:hypothetical protein